MLPPAPTPEHKRAVSRRQLIKTIGAVAGAAAVAHRHAVARAQQNGPTKSQVPPSRPSPPSTVTSPPRDFGQNAPPTTYFSDPDIIAVDPLFDRYVQPNTAIKRLWTGALWA